MCVRCNLGKSVSNICKSLCCVRTLVGIDFTGRTASWQAWVKSESEVAQSCPTLCDPMDCSLSGSVHGIFQARVLEWIAISFSRGSSRPRNRTRVCCIAGRRFTIWATRGAIKGSLVIHNISTFKHSDRLYFLGLQNHCGWWLQSWN